jgi:hypothetical protein
VRNLVNGTPGATSNALNFRTPVGTIPTLPAPATLAPGRRTSPGPFVDTVTPTFTWQAAPAGTVFTGYQLLLRDVSRHRSQIFSADPSATSFALPAANSLGTGHRYAWTLALVNGRQVGPVSQTLFFQAPPAPVPVPTPGAAQPVSPGSANSPGPTLHTLTPTLLWSAAAGITGVTGYQINLVNQTTGRNLFFDAAAGATQFTLPAGTLVAGDGYAWNVRTLANAQIGTPSRDLFFVA